MSLERPILTTVDAGVGTITIDRRERFNSLDVGAARALRKAGLEMSRDDRVRVVVLRGTGGVFCSGADLKYIYAGGDAQLAYLQPQARPIPAGYGEVFKQILEYLHSTISEIRRAPKPFIAAVDGAAAAGGMGLALCCDLVLAAERSTFEYAYLKTALTGAESNTFFLPKILGLRRAMDMVLLNPRLSAKDAAAWGLISRAVPDADFEAHVAEVARGLATAPTGSFAEVKRLMNEAAGVDRLDHHLDRELEALSRAADGADFAEGIRAFFEHRVPRFAGAAVGR